MVCPHYIGMCKNFSMVRDICPKTCQACARATLPPLTARPINIPPPLPLVCGHRPPKIHRVIAGSDALPHSWPWQVVVLSGGRPMCGGSIISAKTIITAAHCVDKLKDSPNFFSVIAGAQNISHSEATAVEYKVKRIIVHPGWSRQTLNNDIAMLVLQTPIMFNKNVSPVCLPNADPPVGTKCFITGWGKTSKSVGMHDVLQEASMPVVDSKVCYEKNKEVIPIPITSAMLCSGDGGHSQQFGCKGDSGGPFSCLIGGRWELHGVVSHGSPQCNSTDTYQVFARVNHFRKWIESYMS